MKDFKASSGKKNDYFWLSIVTRYNLFGHLLKSVPETVVGRVVAITSFDGGPLTPNDDEKNMGWHRFGDILWTDRISDPDVLPWDNQDEWYVFDEETELLALETFVNYGGFLLEDLRPHWRDNPTWDKHLIQSMLQLQEMFWKHIETVQPYAYIAQGDNFNIATKDKCLFNKVVSWSRNPF